MELYLRNIGKIAEASVRIDGISVIAGENDTGKSTIGRVLFSTFNCFYDIENQIHYERFLGIVNVLGTVRRYFRYRYDEGIDLEECAERILSKSDAYREHPELLKDDIYSMFKLESYNIERSVLNLDWDDLTKKILDFIYISDYNIFNSVINKKIDSEFSGQLLNFTTLSDAGKISLKVRDESLHLNVSEEGISIDEIKCSLSTDAVYIDDPFILDDMNQKVFLRNIVFHRRHLEKKLFLERDDISVVEKIVAENKFKQVYDKVSSVCDGNMVRQNDSQWMYQPKNKETAVSIKNMSTGIKTFAILKTLLTNGSIVEKGTIILDEPEIHLHPEWQLLFAELIVLLHKEFKMHILLNTHSPYFLRAIQVYSAKHEISDICRYYLSDVMEDGYAYIEDVTDNVDKIYAKLSRPLQQLEDERWNID